ncbi:hypothetical protein NMY22_g13367 [Coprinellus aureogranulatus]|nr:hypothetical protein NMY22_g13367 [Coprinellus aureogranulatus]
MRLSHVCSDWRAVILGCPDAWSVIQVHPKTAVAILEYLYLKSRDTLLSFSVCGPWIPHKSMPNPWRVIDLLIKIVRENTHRIRTLTFDCAFEEMRKIFFRFTGSFENLEALILLGRASYSNMEDFSNISTPNLRVLHADSRYYIPAPTPLLLTSRRIVDVDVSFLLDYARNPACDPLAFLRAAREIKRLTFMQYHIMFGGPRSYPDLVNFFIGDRPIIELPSLDHLQFSNGVPIGQVIGILRAIHLPNARVHLPISIFSDTAEGTGGLHETLKYLAGSLGLSAVGLAPEEVFISSSHFGAWKYPVCSVTGRVDVPASKLQDSLARQDPWITFPFLGNSMPILSLVSMASPAAQLSFAGLKVLNVGDWQVPKEIWMMIAGLERLEVLSAWCGNDVLYVSQALTKMDPAPGSVPFRALKTLMCTVPSGTYPTSRDVNIEGVFRLTGGQTRSMRVGDALRYQWAFALDVRDALIERSLCDGITPLDTLEFMECFDSVLPEALSQFRGTTADVLWGLSWDKKATADEERLRVHF